MGENWFYEQRELGTKFSEFAYQGLRGQSGMTTTVSPSKGLSFAKTLGTIARQSIPMVPAIWHGAIKPEVGGETTAL